MTKNVTVSVPDDLGKQMESLKEVNWSQVARTAFNQYIIQRKSPDIADLLQELHSQKGEQFMMGRAKAEEVVKFLGYRQFDILMNEYDEALRKRYEQKYTGQRSPIERIFSNEKLMLDMLKRRGRLSKASTAYMQGVIERMKDIRKALG